MKNFIINTNKIYDEIEEPLKFLCCMFLSLIGILLITSSKTILFIFGIIYVFSLVFWRYFGEVWKIKS